MPFRLALSGLNAAQSDLTVTANNIANVGTTGFKGSRAEFADLFATSQQGVASTARSTWQLLRSYPNDVSSASRQRRINRLYRPV